VSQAIALDKAAPRDNGTYCVPQSWQIRIAHELHTPQITCLQEFNLWLELDQQIERDDLGYE
jgi:hypothetical protein